MYPGTCNEKPENFYLLTASDLCDTKGRHVKNLL